jgi:lipopolysaccharide biosynthesis regulator YciM
MLELVWILLPVAAFSGWYAARRSGGREDLSADSPPVRTTDYFEGLNYLLNEQPDKAIEVFIRLVEVDSETVETHVALGNLFRRRGEVERAIRIHQNLIARDTLSAPQRAQALLELGQDYMKAGLFDRAERLFLELIEMRQHMERALRHLVAIYQQEKDWEKAIDTAAQLRKQCGQDMRVPISHYYCELAELARAKGDEQRLEPMLRKALETDTKCVRATVLQGDLEAAAGDYRNAIRTYKRVERQDPAYLVRVLAPLEACYRELGAGDEFRAYLEDLASHLNNVAPALVLANVVREREGERAAANLLSSHLRRHPSIDGIERLISFSAATVVGEVRQDLEMAVELVRQLAARRPSFTCIKCGFTGRELHWQCPGCKSWSTVRPIDVLER